MSPEDAKRRFFLLVGLRFSGVALAFLGIAVIMRRLVEPADIVGTILIAVGIFEVLILPTLLLRKWRGR